MAKKLWISPSAISDFKNCPRLYFFRNIYRNPKTGYRVNIISPQLTLGGIIHETLEKFTFLEDIADRETRLKQLFQDTWLQKSGKKGGFSSEEEETDFKKRGLDMLNRFLKNSHFQDTIPVKLYKSPDYLPKAPLDQLNQEIVLCGKVDWIEELHDGKLHIIDFKTGEKEERADSIQLPFYAYLVWRLKSKPVGKISYWYLNREDVPKEFPLPDMKETEQKISQYAYLIKKSISINSFNCRSSKGTCFWCEQFKPIEKGEAELIDIDHQRYRELYVVRDLSQEKEEINDIPF